MRRVSWIAAIALLALAAVSGKCGCDANVGRKFGVDGVCEIVSRAIARVPETGAPVTMDLFGEIFASAGDAAWDGLVLFGPYDYPRTRCEKLGLEYASVVPGLVSLDEGYNCVAVAVEGNRVVAYARIDCRAVGFNSINTTTKWGSIYRRPVAVTARRIDVVGPFVELAIAE